MLLMAFAMALLSCSRRARVIPARKMEKVYREMFLADQWLSENPDKRKMADTTWFYGSIFEKYGVTLMDYHKSVDHYLNDPKRYAEMMGRVVKGLQDDADRIKAEISRRETERLEAESAAAALSAFAPEEFPYYGQLLDAGSRTDRIEIRQDDKGVYVLVPAVEDTLFRGPELIIRDSLHLDDVQP